MGCCWLAALAGQALRCERIQLHAPAQLAPAVALTPACLPPLRPAPGIFNKIHHDIGTHVVHHLFPQVRPP